MLEYFLSVIQGKNILVTGHTGFKGAWLCIWLSMLGANVTGFSLDDAHPQGVFALTGLSRRLQHLTGDIRDSAALKRAFEQARPDAVLHLAAQPIVYHAIADPLHTFDVNVMGTLNMLECFRASDICQAAIVITSDKCYENKEWVYGYRETDRLGGKDIYSASKGCAELLVHAYRHSYPAAFKDGTKLLVTTRAGNVIGGGDQADYRIVPDSIRSLKAGIPIVLRNPYSVRPWQHVLEPLSGYLKLLARALSNDHSISGAWNFAPLTDSSITVEALAQRIIKAWGEGSYQLGKSIDLPESALLYLDSSKARRYLDWSPIWEVDTTIEKTVEWYKMSLDSDAFKLCADQIKEYCKQDS